MLNLFDYLTEEDNKKIEDYIYSYGSSDYIGNKEYLKYWADNNKKLFHLLGGNLIYKVPIKVEKEKNEILNDVRNLINTHDFYVKFAEEVEDKVYKYDDIPDIKKVYLVGSYDFADNKYPHNIKIKLPHKNTTLQIKSGMKVMKAYQKILDYFDFSDDTKKLFEDFRIKHSIIFNDKALMGKLCFSIHPLDFITMSDNASNWSSCMSWKEEGCYHLGTVEMMNSNNVICVYLESETPFEYGVDRRKNTWNNKKWRQLFYCTKEIIVSGKSYPYYNESITKKALEILRDLAKKNWNHEYEYGIEPYKDMIHIGSKYRVDNNRDWIYDKRTTKHNIIFDTNGMYNDMLNDQNFNYWCVRNKVKKNTIIKYSGKTPCVCCMDEVKTENYVYDYDREAYNDRYHNVNSVICGKCMKLTFCDCCNDQKIEKTIALNLKDGSVRRICKDCLNAMRYCPVCGKKMIIRGDDSLSDYGRKFFEIVEDIPDNETISYEELEKANKHDTSGRFIKSYMCYECRDNNFDNYKNRSRNLTGDIDFPGRFYFSKKVFNRETAIKYSFNNLRKVELSDLKNITRKEFFDIR